MQSECGFDHLRNGGTELLKMTRRVTQGNNVTTILFTFYFVLETYRPEETGLTEPTFSNSWAFAATLKNNLTIRKIIQVQVKFRVIS